MNTATLRLDFMRAPFLVMGAACVAIATSGMYYAGPWALLIAGTQITVGILVGSYFGVVQVDRQEITLYRTTRIKWADIRRLKATSFLGLPYILVWRKWPWPVWVPLYTVGEVSLLKVLAHHASPGTTAAVWFGKLEDDQQSMPANAA